MIVLGRHRGLTEDAWSESTARTVIDEIATDAIAEFHPNTFWPSHPSDDGVGDGNTSFYVGAAGVIWALDYLRRIGAAHVREDFRPLMPKLLERTTAEFERHSRPEYAKHGSLLFGDMGAALLAMRLAPTSNLADLVHARAEANTGLPIRELMWGMPGSMLAAVHMAELTQESGGAAYFKFRPLGCSTSWRIRRKASFGRKNSTAPTIVGLGRFTVSPATSSRSCAGGIG